MPDDPGCAHCGHAVGGDGFVCSECRGARVCRDCAGEAGMLGLARAWDLRLLRLKAVRTRKQTREREWKALQDTITRGRHAQPMGK